MWQVGIANPCRKLDFCIPVWFYACRSNFQVMKLLFLCSTLFLAGLLSQRPATTIALAERYNERNPVFCAPSFDTSALNAGNAPMFKGLGSHQYKITTGSAKAQQYFNQGFRLLYGFNHGEAGRSFRAAIKADSTCAMAYWGMGMVLGPNYNAALNPGLLKEINEAMDNAVRFAVNASAKEQALVRALAKRFPRQPVEDMTPYNAAYATAMKDAYRQFSNDADIAALYADALMNEHPWNLWLKDGQPQPWTPAIVEVLEQVLQQWPQHPGANHMYIHAMEASRQAHKALPAADRLRNMMPAAGHMVHMPSHIYIRTGRYHDGVVANEKASHADSNYISQCKVQSSYALLLYPHNVHFLAACAFFEGNSKKAIDAAWRVARITDKRYLHENTTLQHYYSIPYYVLVHLGKWNEILKLNQPGESLKYPVAVWHYARGMAYTALGNINKANQELLALQKIADDKSLASMLIWETNNAGQLVQIAQKILSAEIAARDAQYNTAIALLNEAVELESQLTYQEPPDWFFSVRHSLGHVLVKAGRFAEAEKVYREDLVTYPDNGWALMGLYNSLVGQQKMAEARQVKARFEDAWKHADIRINSSRVVEKENNLKAGLEQSRSNLKAAHAGCKTVTSSLYRMLTV
jgi:tetratricopeptide (TPR) repeat protein